MTSRCLRTPSWVLALFLAFSACSSTAEHHESGPRVYPLPAAPHPGPSDAWPMPPEKAEILFTTGEIRMRERKGAGGGVTGASRVTLYSPADDLTFKAKWKPVPYFLESWNNSPRRELAAYAVQKLFLEPRDYVVPTTAIRCFPVDQYREFFPGAAPNLDNSTCVLGVFALWLDNVTIETTLLEPERFAKDPNYAYHMSNFNILTYLIDHKDGRSNNFLVSTNQADRRVFAIDNGISFDAWIWNWFVPNWNSIKVPALNRAAVDRLRQVTPAEIDALAVVAELHLGDDGIYRVVAAGPNLDPDEGVRTAPGIVQFGLEEDEVDDVHEQIEEILEMVDSGEVPVF